MAPVGRKDKPEQTKLCCTALTFNGEKRTKLKVFNGICLADSKALQNPHHSVKPSRQTVNGAFVIFNHL